MGAKSGRLAKVTVCLAVPLRAVQSKTLAVQQYGDEVFRLAAERGKPFILGNRSGGAGTPDRIAPAKCIPGGFIGNPAFGQCSAALKTLNLLRGLVVIRSISFHRLKIDKAAA